MKKFKEFVLEVSFLEPDTFNSPMHWLGLVDEPMLSYHGDPISEMELLDLIAKGALDNVMEDQDLDMLENGYDIENLSGIAKGSSSLDEFVKKASEDIFSAFEGSLYKCCHILDEGADSIPHFEDAYTFSYNVK